jgi:hypothetical protein
MPNVMINCPILKVAVPTGLDTETVVFESLPSIELPFKCPSCGRTHQWKPIGFKPGDLMTTGMIEKRTAWLCNRVTPPIAHAL